MFECDFYSIRSSTGNRIDAIEGVVSDNSVSDIELQIVSFIYGDAIARAEPEDHAVFYVNCLGLENVYSIYAVTESVDRKSVTTSVAAALIMIPFTREARIEAKVPEPSSVIDLVIVTAPKPPGSRASISPQAAVFEIAPAHVLHGAVRLQGLASSPTPDTQVREACAWAIDANATMKVAIAKILIVNRNLFI
jgi:hypothetical protein